MMAIASLPLPPPTILGLPARNGCAGRRPRMAVVSCKHKQSTDVQGASSTSRRDALSYISTVFLATFLVADRAEAKTSRQENKKKAREKLEKLREKALGPNEKEERVANLLAPPIDAYI